MTDGRIELMGAICGDIIGSTYEFNPTWRYKFQMFRPHSTFTDDTVMTVAVADWVMNGGDLTEILRKWGLKYPFIGYGPMFFEWLTSSNPQPYNSYGNGSAMRVSPVGWMAKNETEALELAKHTAEITHNHPEGIKGAQAVALAIYLAKKGTSKDEIRRTIHRKFGYNLKRTCDEIRESYKFHATCQKSVPESIICFLESEGYEDAVRLAVTLGGDADTMACIAGSIASAYYKTIPDKIAGPCLDILPEDIYEIVMNFSIIHSLN